MLVLSRKTGQRIQIGDDITIVVSSIRGGQVRLGVDAPKDVGVFRQELGRALHQDRPPQLKTPRPL
jgi:carbon storage regulator